MNLWQVSTQESDGADAGIQTLWRQPTHVGHSSSGEAKSKVAGKAAWQGTWRTVITEGWIFFSFLKLPTETISHIRQGLLKAQLQQTCRVVTYSKQT